MEGTDKLQFTTDSRTHKASITLVFVYCKPIEHLNSYSFLLVVVMITSVLYLVAQIEDIKHCPFGEVCLLSALLPQFSLVQISSSQVVPFLIPCADLLLFHGFVGAVSHLRHLGLNWLR